MIKSDIDGLSKWSKEVIELVCDSCGIEKSMKYKLYTSYGYENGEYYCRKCKTKINNLEKWGVENVFQSKEIKEKIKKTNLKKWGVENPSQNGEINKKIKESISKLDKNEINKKRESTNLEKWGVENVSQCQEIKDKKVKTNIKNWGTDNNKKSDIFRKNNFKVANHPNYIKYYKNGVSIFRCDKGHEFKIEIDNFSKRIKYNSSLCTECFPIGNNKSSKEINLYNYINSIYNGEIIQSYRDGLEIDVYLPELKLGFEFNGIYWHSDLYKDKKSHLSKTIFFKKKGIRIIHIWEDHWDNKRDILESQIKNWLGLTQNKIFARKCIVKEIKESKIVSEFLEENHIQGKIGSNLKIGLYFEEQLVSLMTFDNLEGRNRMEVGNWNINRFCNKREYTVVGGASKIFKYFIKNYKVNRVISYADRDWSLGHLYKNLGFNKISESKPDYKYVVNSDRVHKSKFKKSKTGISESDLGIPKIWDCGKVKYEFLGRE